MKRILSVIIALVMLATCVTVAAAFALAVPASAASPFDDVAESRWSYASVNYAVNKGYMKGTGERKFSPADTLTRAMVATVLWRRQGEPAPTAPSGFSDVPEGKWYSEAIAWAKETGVVQGVSDTKFKPNDNVTREQLATMLFRFSETAPVCVPERADLGVFPDGSSVRDWAREAMGWAVEAALVKGSSDGSLDPAGYATREQFAAIIERFDDTFKLVYNQPVLRSHYTEKPYPLVEDADLYVAPDGDDGADGSFDHPLATFRGAVAKVRGIKAAKTGDITVAFKAGTYGPVELELGSEDSGSPDQRITYCKYGDGDVVFDNGITIKDTDFLPLDESEKSMFQSKLAGKIKKLDLGALIGEIPSLSDFAMFSENALCTLARYPNKFGDGTDRFINTSATVDETTLLIYPTLSKRLDKYPADSFADILLYGYIVRGYRKDTFTVESYDRETKLLTVGQGSSGEFGKKLRLGWSGEGDHGILMFVQNVAYELDSEGEYWIDRSTGILYVFDPSGDYRVPMPHGEYRLRGIVNYDTGDGYPASPGYCAISAEDTGYITFRGLDFTNNVGEFVMGYRTSGFEFDRCRFDRCTGDNQLLFEHSLPDTPLGLSVTDSEFDLCIGRHVYVYDEAVGPERFTNRSEILVDNCFFSRSNLVYDAEGAVNLHACSGGTVSHNRFENCYRYAVMFTDSCDVIVEYNDFDSAMTNSDDGGVTRGCGDVLGNNIVRYNFYNTLGGGMVGHFAHYCDNGDCGTVMYSNLLYNAGIVCYHGAGRDNVLNDNVMIDESGMAIGSLTEGIIESGRIGGAWSLVPQWETIRSYIENVPGYAEALEKRRPGITSLLFDPADAADRAFFLAPTSTFNGNLFINDEAKINFTFVNNSLDYCTVENNVAVTKTENPVFVNPTLGDYRIREGADFPDIRFEMMGRY